MGFHTCEYCPMKDKATTSSGDIFLGFASGNTYLVPDMIMHYVEVHGYRPDEAFMNDVMWYYVDPSIKMGRNLYPVRVGYLHGTYPQGKVSAEFIVRLEAALDRARQAGNRMQTRGM